MQVLIGGGLGDKLARALFNIVAVRLLGLRLVRHGGRTAEGEL